MLKRWFTPGFADLILAALVTWLFLFSPDGWSLLLNDGDTGWHIRTGQWILENRQVPHTDLFSFTRAGEPWFAWEWGADVLFALLHSVGGLALVSLTCGLLLLTSSLIALRWMIWRGASVLAAFPVLLLSIGGSTMHFLARPHVFTLIFFVASLWLLDAERRHPSRRIWLLIPITILWTNIHGGWPVLFILLATQIVARLIYKDPLWLRDLRVALACAIATLFNPYGWHLHQHIFGYVQNDWIREAVDEFQSPKFRAENLLQFEILLLAGVATAFGRVRRGVPGLTEALTVWFWAHMALSAVRHAPLFILAASPVISAELTLLLDSLWQNVKKSSLLGVFKSLDQDIRPKFAYNSAWAILLPAILWAANPPRIPADFPSRLFPVEAVRQLAGDLEGRRIYTSDQWGDYLIYRLWPRTKVFFDGRSDFYGASLGGDYLALATGSSAIGKLLDQHRIDIALVPAQGDLTRRYQALPGWQLVHSDPVSHVYRRLAATAHQSQASQLFSPSGLMKAPPSSEGIRENRP